MSEKRTNIRVHEAHPIDAFERAASVRVHCISAHVTSLPTSARADWVYAGDDQVYAGADPVAV